MKTVLIVGGSGFIGRHTVRHLVASRWRVFATYRAGKVRPPLADVTWLPCDLARADATVGWPRRVDAILFLAQSAAWRSFPGGSEDVFRVNLAGLMQTVAYAQRAGVRCFVHASSGSVCTLTGQPAVEAGEIDLLNLRDFYPASKLAGEILLRPFQSLFATTIVRLFMPYGPGQNPTMLLPRLVRCVREGQPIQLHGTDGLLANPVAVTDVARALERCLLLQASCTLNVAGPEQLTLREIGETIGTVLGREPVFECQPGQQAPVIVGDTARLQTALGWTPATPLEAGLQLWLAEEAEEEPVVLRYPDKPPKWPARVG